MRSFDSCSKDSPSRLSMSLASTTDSTPGPLLALHQKSGLPMDRLLSAGLRSPRASQDDLELPTGTLMGAYQVTGVIGRGGMSTVYSATHPDHEVPLAIKIARPSVLDDPVMAERWVRELEVMSQWAHPGIVPVIEVGAHDGGFFLVMELMPGRDLAHELAQGPVDVARALMITLQLATTLAAAHARGLIHRDLKPGNILLDAEGRPRLSDFGLSSNPDSQDSDVPPIFQLTERGDILGTADYSAPEQSQRGLRHSGPSADVYSLGVILYHMLTGFTPRGIFPPASTIAAAPPALDDVIHCALQHDPSARFPTMDAFAAALTAATDPFTGPAIPPSGATNERSDILV
jgi:eukaryotic-like serine/threonine-protein kinase